MHEDTLTRLEVSRKELLDLGLRNRLINHPKRVKQIEVVDELSSEIFRILVSEGKKMSFSALPDEKLEEILDVSDGEESEDISWEQFFSKPSDDTDPGSLPERHTDTKLQTNLNSTKLQSKLLSIHNDARTIIEEQGVNLLYLVCGFLNWYESTSANEPRRAPLLLIPVELERGSVKERFKVRYSGADIGDNLSLAEKLQNDFSLTLPRLGDDEDLNLGAYFQSVSKSVCSDNRWTVESDEICLGFFSFGKFLMYKDLATGAWSEEARGEGFSILNSLLSDGFEESSFDFGEDTQIDGVDSASQTFQVKDADSSQILAIMAVNSGKNLVLQGPPGTGKSQTITNIIAECIGLDKTVLFVSEKMAALDVVKRRLDGVGLGDAVLELHSNKTNKKKVLAELDRTLSQGKPLTINAEAELSTLEELKNKLNRYCEAVNAPIGKTQITFIQALGSSFKTYSENCSVKPLDFQPMSSWSDSDYRAAQMRLMVIDNHLEEFGDPRENPFNQSSLTELLPSQQKELNEALRICFQTATKLNHSGKELSGAMGFDCPTLVAEIGVICRAARRAMDAPHLEGLILDSSEWQVRRDDLTSLIGSGKTVSQAHVQYDKLLINEAWNQDLIEVRQQLVTKGNKWWRFLSGDFRRAKDLLAGLCREPLTQDMVEIIQMVDTVLDTQKHQNRFNELAELGAQLFGAQWKKEDSDWEVLEQLQDWIVVLYRDVGTGDVPGGIVDFLAGSPKIDPLQKMVIGVEANLDNHKKQMIKVEGLLGHVGLGVSGGLLEVALDIQIVKTSYWQEHLEELRPLVRFNFLAAEFEKEGLSFVADVAKKWPKTSGSIAQYFEHSWFNGLVEKSYMENPEIRKFDRSEHVQMLKEFVRLDKLQFRFNQMSLARKHWDSIPKYGGGGELRIISREINKKRRHLSIRKLISDAGNAIQAIKPVFMMSPMSIATYLPPGTVEFDLVVFDEASQVKPVDAFGAIIRGKQTVVVGDSKQLPPTNFFDSVVESSQDDDFDNIGDMESILSLFLGKGASQRMLRWHYRSRHESLIAVSNHEFYDNRLVVFPSPGGCPTARGLRHNHLPDTAYDRGKTRTNPQEATAVAKAVLEHAKCFPDLTLGVVAFSTAQRDGIEVQLELLRRDDSSCENFFKANRQEPFFIKNLENVQGDERDVIFISIGYGKTKEGFLSMGFGPLNRDGGERRLNVLISRARMAMDVFSNFSSDDIDLNRSKARGVAALKSFLAYAKSGEILQPYSSEKDPDSPFEEEVIKALAQHGIEVEPQIGTAGFFVDIGVKDSESPGRFILGIECDGATYHSSRSARDRDRLRQEVLEGLGWRLHRIWSTDWYRNRELEIERTLEAIKNAEADYRATKGNDRKKIESAVETDHEIKREDPTPLATKSSNTVNFYIQAKIKILLKGRDLHQLSLAEMALYIENIVEIESPVHKVEIVRRITEGAGLKRAGGRIQALIKRAIAYSVKRKLVEQKGEFIWILNMGDPEIRNRSLLDSRSKKVDLISPEEMRKALLLEVNKGFSLGEDEAVLCVAREFGFKRLTAQSKELFRVELGHLVELDKLVLRKGVYSVV